MVQRRQERPRDAADHQPQALDPFERFHDARGFDEWQENRSWTLAPAIGVVKQFFASFDEYPPRQASMEVNVDDIMHEMMEPNAP